MIQTKDRLGLITGLTPVARCDQPDRCPARRPASSSTSTRPQLRPLSTSRCTRWKRPRSTLKSHLPAIASQSMAIVQSRTSVRKAGRRLRLPWPWRSFPAGSVVCPNAGRPGTGFAKAGLGGEGGSPTVGGSLPVRFSEQVASRKRHKKTSFHSLSKTSKASTLESWRAISPESTVFRRLSPASHRLPSAFIGRPRAVAAPGGRRGSACQLCSNPWDLRVYGSDL